MMTTMVMAVARLERDSARSADRSFQFYPDGFNDAGDMRIADGISLTSPDRASAVLEPTPPPRAAHRRLRRMGTGQLEAELEESA